MKKKCLNFGCGTKIKESTELEEWDNCDIQKEAPLCFDFNVFPYNKLKENYYDYILIEVVLENLNEPTDTLFELHRKCKGGGVIEILAPFWNNKGAWSDPHVKRGFNKIYFILVAERHESYYINSKPVFRIETLDLIPTYNVGKFIPKWVREKLSNFVGGLIMHIHVKYEVLK